MFRYVIIGCINLSLLLVSVNCTDTYSRHDFPPGFIFGSSTSAYQIEGAVNEDGRTPSIWDTFTHNGYVNGYTGDIAAGQYHKYKEDVKLMVDTGLDAYRFSISWSRLIPNGRGPVNPKGLQYYNNLIDELISHGIQPHVTLWHFDFPQALEDEYGGWLSPKIVKDFTDYADVCFKEFGERVRYWTTLNEPNLLVWAGYDLGVVPPNRCSLPFGFNCSKGNSLTEPYLAAHNILLAHASAVRLYRKSYQRKQCGFVGINMVLFGYVPLTNSTEDVLATQRAYDFTVGLFMNPLVYGDYPDKVKERAGLRLPGFTNYESKLVKGSFDFIGINHYETYNVSDNPNTLQPQSRDFFADMAVNIGINLRIEYAIMPWGMQSALEHLKKVYGNPPLYIHENGQRTLRNSSQEDTSRVKYIHSYIGALLDSVRNGLNLKGYFTWSFLDAFELIDGYDSSFGLYYVDLNDPELKRYPKLSAHWYSHFLKGENVSSDQIMQLGSKFSLSYKNHSSQ